ncbi:MAG TPA: ABC transporter substrate-binding protein [Actinomycetes bacterium]|nr:ABC transporter substrate-binding protein [Actinomycetes bacterium]
MRNVRVRLVLAAVATLALVAAGCGGGGDDDGSTQAPAATAPAGDAVNLAEVCPNPVVIQTDWDPESEYGVYYHLLGPNPKVDTKKKLVSGSLVAGGKDTGVRLEVRTGGPSIGFEPVSSQMYKDPAITLGQVSTDEAIRFSAKQATLAVVAPMEISPFMIMWDPQAYPQFNTIADIGKTDTKVLYFEGDTYMAYLTGTGVLKKSQVDGSYDGKPGNFVAADGKVAQAGFATSEPYIYEHEVRQWGKPVKYALVNEAGYPFYPQALSIRAADKDKLAPCLKKLVPIIQRAQVDYLANPTETNKFVVDLVKQYNDGWVYSEGLANYAIEKMRSDFVKNGSDKTLGNFDNARLQRMIEIVTPIFTAQNQPPKSGLKPEDIATNEFIDTSIGVPA